MKIGLQIPRFTWPGGDAAIAPTLKQIVQTADDGGFASLWLMDHLFQIRGIGAYTEPMLEGYSGLSYIAALTSKARLGTMVTGVVYRYPGLLVKTATTLDVLSGGRAYMGIGAAWNEQESKGLGVPFPPVAERFERLEEALQIAHQMWSGDNGPYNGRHYQLAETICEPMPLSKPHPPILIGGMGEKKTLRMVAQYADACNLFYAYGRDEIVKRLDTLKRHCETLGRNYDAIEKTTLNTVPAGAVNITATIDILREQASLGFQQAIFNMQEVETLTPVETFIREVIPAVAEF
jgi:F420-dependent oxidoreductase-like protein